MMMKSKQAQDSCPLSPIDPKTAEAQQAGEEEQKSNKIVKSIAESLTGRVAFATYESLKASGQNVVCLSPWGDSSPVLLPCIRFRDLVTSGVMAAKGGTGAIAAPVYDPITDAVTNSLGSSVVVNLAMGAGLWAAQEGADALVIEKPIHLMSGTHDKHTETTNAKRMMITLPYKHTKQDAALGFFRSSVHRDTGMVSHVKDYLSVEKGWFSPYLYSSARRPVIPRSMQPDVVFCHGPFIQGDYTIGTTLLHQSASVIAFCDLPLPPETKKEKKEKKEEKKENTGDSTGDSSSKLSALTDKLHITHTNEEKQPAPSRESSPDSSMPVEGEQVSTPVKDQPRRMVIALVGLKPHRKYWTSSDRPGESVINYVLLDGCPAIVVPVKPGTPLISWDTLTLAQLWKIPLPDEDKKESVDGKFEGVVEILTQFVEMCADWERAEIGDGDDRRGELSSAIGRLLIGAIRSKECKEATKEIDADRAGIAMWRIP